MRYKPGQKEETRARILEAAGRGFRRHGYAGIGVDGLAREASVTSGAFYGHFSSKERAFEAAMEAGLDALLAGIDQCRSQGGEDWLVAFIDFYLGERRRAEAGLGCALQILTPEIARAGADAKTIYERKLAEITSRISEGLWRVPAERRPALAHALLALLAGAVTLARAAASPALADAISEAAAGAARAMIGHAPQPASCS